MLVRFIAILEVVGGIVGILFMLYAVMAAGFAWQAVVVAPLLIGVFVLSLFAGIWLWQGKEKGRKASIIVQCIQVPKLVSSPFIFMFTFGLDMYVYFALENDLSKIGIQFSFLADAQFFVNSSAPIWLIGVSLPALVALGLLTSYDASDPLEEITQAPPGPGEYLDLN